MAENDSTIPEWPAKLKEIIALQFNRDELRDLCFDLDVDFEELPEGAKSTQVIALIRLAGNNGRLVNLIDSVAELRPAEDLAEIRAKAVAEPDLFVIPDDDSLKDLLRATIATLTPAEAQTIDGQAPEAGESPYKGLNSFDVDDADEFFGREMLTAKIIGRLEQSQFLAVIGASGSGKSSLIRAGVVASLKSGQVLADGSKPPAESAKWVIDVMTPTAHPAEALTAAEQRLMAQTGPQKMLVVDQFEEIFTICRSQDERDDFVQKLVGWVEAKTYLVVITMRADFYAQCAQYDSLRDLISNNQEYIGAMTKDELTRVILQPAANGGWHLQDGLVETMLDDVGSEPGALPLLSHALLETWKRRHGRTMTLSSYQESGGVKGAIAQTAESIFKQRLSADQQPIAQMIFMRLTEIGAGDGDTPDTRRQAAFSELITRSTDQSTLDAVLDILIDARLITISLLPPEKRKVIEVAHEALIREWPTLRSWLDQDRQGLIQQRQLTADVEDWLKLDKDDGMLYRGARLKQMGEWAAQNSGRLSLEEQAFLDASHAIVAKEAEQVEQLASAGRNQRLLIGLAAVLAVAVIGVSAFFWFRPAPETEPAAEVMNGEFNIAVAEIAVLNDAGQSINGESDAGKVVAERIQSMLTEGVNTEDGFEVWASDSGNHVDVGVVSDDLFAQKPPKARAEEIGADVVIYGTLRPQGDLAELFVEFYLAPQYDMPVSNLVGTHSFQEPIKVFDIDDPGREIDAELAPKVEAVTRIARGLDAGRLGDLEAAAPDFEQAALLVPSSGFAHFFEGEVKMLLAQRTIPHDEALLSAAEEAFLRAPEHAKAQIGLGTVHFVRAQSLMADQEARNANFEGEFATNLESAETEAQTAIEIYNGVIAGGPQIETYGVPVDAMAQVGWSMAARRQSEIWAFRTDYERAFAELSSAIESTEGAISTLEASAVGQKDFRLLSQAYQALGTFYFQQEWYLANQFDRSDEAELAKQNSIDAFGKCIALGEEFPFDTYMVEEIIGKLCQPIFDQLTSS